MQYKLNDFEKEQLQKIANRLPEVHVMGSNNQPIPIVKQIHGSTLIEQEIKTIKDDSGKEIAVKPNKKYTRQVGFVCVDHYKNLEKAWLQGGMEKVNAYFDKYMK